MFIVVALIAFTARLATAAGDPRQAHDDDRAQLDAAEATDVESIDPAWSDAGAPGARDAALHRAPSGMGRIDLTVTWRRTVRVAEMRGTHGDGADSVHPIASPLDPVTTARGVLWVLLTWSR